MVADGPLVGRLQLEPLPLPLLVVRGDAIGRLRRHVLDAEDVVHDLGLAERSAAGMAVRSLVFEVARAARAADPHRCRGEPRVGGRSALVTDRQDGADDAVRAALVIDEAARPELGEREEARALEVRLTTAAVARRGNVGHEGEAREVVAGQEALGREVAVRVEVARVGAVAFLEQVELVDRLGVAALRGALLLLGRGVVVHDATGGVPRLLGGLEEVAPAAEGLFEATEGALHDRGGEFVGARVPGSQLLGEIGFEEVEESSRARDSLLCCPGLDQRSPDLGTQGALRVIEEEELGDRRVQRLLGAGEPEGGEVALDEIAVREIEERRADLSVDHRLGVPEEVLVVRALRRAVGEDESGLAATAGATASLRVVGGCGRNVAQVDGVEGGDVDAEFHRRGAEEDGEEAVRLADLAQVLLVGGEVRLLFGAVAEALLADRTLLCFDLCGVGARFECEERVRWLAQGVGEVRVEVAEEGILVRVDGVDHRRALAEEDARVVELPSDEPAEGGGLLGDDAVCRGGL